MDPIGMAGECRRTHRWSWLAGTVLAAGLAACDLADNPSASPGELSIARVSGNAQQGVKGALLASPLVVLVTDARGQPVVNQRVDFEVTAGRATLTLETVVTDAQGCASTRVRLGDEAGEVTVQAAVFSQPGVVVFRATVTEPRVPEGGGNVTVPAGADSVVVPATGAFLQTTTSGNLVFEFVAGYGLGDVEFGLGTPAVATSAANRDVIFTAHLDHSGASVSPSRVVDKGYYPAGSGLEFYGYSVFGGTQYWAFSSHLGQNPTPSDLVMFTDTDYSLGWGGSVVDVIGPDEWVLHLDDAASVCCDDDDNELVVRVRVE